MHTVTKGGWLAGRNQKITGSSLGLMFRQTERQRAKCSAGSHAWPVTATKKMVVSVPAAEGSIRRSHP